MAKEYQKLGHRDSEEGQACLLLSHSFKVLHVKEGYVESTAKVAGQRC